MRALHAAASGMAMQQLNVDTIANNLANVNTTGFKSGRVQFQEMLYAEVQSPMAGAAQGVRIGQGVRLSNIRHIFADGQLQATGSQQDLAIQGAGFFRALQNDGTVAYTRDGAFHVDGQGRLATASGSLLLGANGPIAVPDPATDVTIAPDGSVSFTDAAGQRVEAGRLSLALFANPAGLIAMGDRLWAASAASGQPLVVSPGEGEAGRLSQGYLEASNVEVADEMVTLMEAQRAYQLTARVLQTADEMLSLANNLRRG